MGQHGTGTSAVSSLGKGAGQSAAANTQQLSAYQSTNAAGAGLQANDINKLATEELQRRSANAIVAALPKGPTSPNAIDDTSKVSSNGAPGVADNPLTKKVGATATGAIDSGIQVQNPKADPTTITRGTVFAVLIGLCLFGGVL